MRRASARATRLALLALARQRVEPDREERPDQEKAGHQRRHVLIRVAEHDVDQQAHHGEAQAVEGARQRARAEIAPALRRASATVRLRPPRAPRAPSIARPRLRSCCPPFVAAAEVTGTRAARRARHRAAPPSSRARRLRSVTTLAPASAATSGCAALRRRHQVALAEDHERRAAHRRGRREAAVVRVARERSTYSTPGRSRSISRIAAPVIHMPGTRLPPNCFAALCDQPLISSNAT